MQAPAPAGGAAPAAFLLAMPRIVGGAAPAAAGGGATILGGAAVFAVAAGGVAIVFGGAMILGGVAAAAVVAELGGVPADFARNCVVACPHKWVASSSKTANFAFASATSLGVLASKMPLSSLRNMAS